MFRLFEKLLPFIPSRFRLPASYWYLRAKRSQERELEIIDALCTKGMVCVDVGANVGIYSHRLAKLGFKVEAFEPNPAASKTIEDYSCNSITLHNVGLSSARGELDLFVPVIDGTEFTGLASFRRPEGFARVLKVSVGLLDDFEIADVGFIKIDVEGHEDEVIEGAKTTIAKWRPVLLIEIERKHRQKQTEDLFCRLSQMNYEALVLGATSLLPLKKELGIFDQLRAFELQSVINFQ